MHIINLRKHYPHYTEDIFIEVSDEIYEVILLSIRQKNNYNSRMYYHKAHYSLDCGDGIENDALHRMPSPEEIFMQKVSMETITANALMNTDYPPLAFSIEKLLPQGIFILAGSGKIGKSWLALDMCVAVSTGGELWDFHATQGDVLYLALEDTHPRLQNRLQLIQEENINTDNLHLAISSLGISDGLITQMKEFLSINPQTKLIVIDTLERIRNTDQDKSMYACDYRDMTALREITNAHAVTLLLVHHTRKMYDPDPLNTLSGSTGLVGAVDGVWVLEKEKRIGDKGKLTIANRDTEGYCFSVMFDKDNCRWNCLGSAEGVCIVTVTLSRSDGNRPFFSSETAIPKGYKSNSF